MAQAAGAASPEATALAPIALEPRLRKMGLWALEQVWEAMPSIINTITCQASYRPTINSMRTQ